MASPNIGTHREARLMVPSDFIFVKVIGKGSFSTVYLAQDIVTHKELAVKVLEKDDIVREKKTKYTRREIEVLRVLGNSSKYFVHLYGTFKDHAKLYFVLTYAINGDILKHIQRHKKFNTECTRYYSAELVLALEYLHAKKIVHRDLKPENILFDHNFHILLINFGSAKIENDGQNQTSGNSDTLDSRWEINGLVGTPQFISPEMIQESKSSFSSDLWALGCLVFQMASGQMAFFGESKQIIFQKILRLEYTFPDNFDWRLKDFVKNLLVLESENRLGATDEILYTSLREHGIFDGANWDNLGPPPRLSGIEFIQRSNSSASRTFVDKKPNVDSKEISKVIKYHIPPPSRLMMPIRSKKSKANRKIADFSPEEIANRLRHQEKNPYNVFVAGNLILKQGLIIKGKGLFRKRRRILLLTLGPHLFYVDPKTMTFKGEIPWSSDIRTEAKNFDTFCIHIPNRKYHLKDPNGDAWGWIGAIEQVKQHYFPGSNIRNNN